MKSTKKVKTETKKRDKARLIAILVVSILVIITGTMFVFGSIRNNNMSGAVLGSIIAIIILIFAIMVYKRGNADMKGGFPIQDERSKKVMRKAMATSYLVTLYMLLAIGFLSDKIIKFRDVSQATSISVGLMALLFLIFWIYYNNKEL